MEGRPSLTRSHLQSERVPFVGADFAFPTFVAPVIPGQSFIGEGIGVAAAEHSHPWWIYELAGAVSDAALVATGDFNQEELDRAEGGLLFFDTAANTLYYRRSDGTYRTEVM